ncbi:MAG: hypothetical protein QNJ42_10885 [Crocosphaera sp.]|nr:hypothetical protein [Crocosphaera sp.]
MKTLTWIAFIDGEWHDLLNWLNGELPNNNPDDQVVIDVPTDITTTYTQGETIINSLTSEEVFKFSGGSLRVIDNGQLNKDFYFGSSNYSPESPYFITDGIVNLNKNSFFWQGTLTGTFINNGSAIFEQASKIYLKEAIFINEGFIVQKFPNLKLDDTWVINKTTGTIKLLGSNYGLPSRAVEGMEIDTVYLTNVGYGFEPDYSHIRDLYSLSVEKSRLINEGGTIIAEQGVGGNYVEISVSVEDYGGTLKAAPGSNLAFRGDGLYKNTNIIVEKDATISFLGHHHSLEGIKINTKENGWLHIGGSGTILEAQSTIELDKTFWGDMIGGFSTLTGSGSFVNKNDFLITTGKEPTLIPSLYYLAVLVDLLSYSQHFLKTILHNLKGATLRTSEGYIDLRIAKEGMINNEGHFILKAEVGSKSDLSGVNITDHNDDGGQIINQSTGIITKTGSQEAFIGVQLNNYGLIDIKEGVLKLTHNGQSTDATYLVSEDAHLMFRSYADGYHFSNTVINNQGRLDFNRGQYHFHDEFIFNGMINWFDSNYSSTTFQGEGEAINTGIFTIKDGVEFRIDLNFTNQNHLLITENLALGKILSNAENSKLSFSGGKRISIRELSNNTSSQILNKGLIELIDHTKVKVQVFSIFDNSLVSLKSGSLTLAGGGSFVNTHFSIAESSTLSFSGEDGYINGHINQLKNTTFENNGQIFFTKGRNSHDIAAIASSNIELGGQVFWQGGTLASSDSGLFNMNGDVTFSGNIYLEAQLNNLQQITHKPGTLWLKGGEINNFGNYNLNGGNIQVWAGYQALSEVNNHGTFNNINYSAYTDTEISAKFNNDGILQAEIGELTLSGGGTNSGQMIVGEKGRLTFDDGRYDQSFRFTENSTLNNRGIVEIRATIITEVDSPFIFNGKTKLYSSGELTGETGYSNQGIFQFIGGKITNSNFFNEGKAILSTYRDFSLIDSIFTNEIQGVLEITNGRIKTTSFSQNHLVDNKGTIIAQQGQIEGDLINSNTIIIDEKKLVLRESFTQHSGSLILKNNGHLESWDTININGGVVTGEGVISARYTPVNFDAATISAGMTEGDIGQLTIRAEKFRETDQTNHIFELEDFNKFDQLVIKPINDYTSQGGIAHLDGRYHIKLNDNLRNQLQLGQTFEIVKFNQVTLDDGIELENTYINEDLHFEALIDEHSLKLIVVNHNSQTHLLLGDDTDQSHRNTLSKDSLLEGGLDNNILANAARDILASDERPYRNRFSFSSPTDGIDTITDFTVADDVIELAANGFNLPLGQIDSSQFTLGSAASTNTHRLIYNDSNGDLLFDNDGNGAAAATPFANLDPNLALTHQHFVVV